MKLSISGGCQHEYLDSWWNIRRFFHIELLNIRMGHLEVEDNSCGGMFGLVIVWVHLRHPHHRAWNVQLCKVVLWRKTFTFEPDFRFSSPVNAFYWKVSVPSWQLGFHCLWYKYVDLQGESWSTMNLQIKKFLLVVYVYSRFCQIVHSYISHDVNC